MRKIQVLGTGCPKCKVLLENAVKACSGLDSECEVEKIDKINDILDFGVMMTPALAIDGKVRSVGKVLSEDEIVALLEKGD